MKQTQIDQGNADLTRLRVKLFPSGLASLKVCSCALPTKAFECLTMASCIASTPLISPPS